METLENFTKLVNLEEVPPESVEPKSSYSEWRIVLDLKDLRRVTTVVHQPPLSQVEAKLIKVRWDVLTQGVVHVEPVAGDGGEVQALIHEYLLRIRDITGGFLLKL